MSSTEPAPRVLSKQQERRMQATERAARILGERPPVIGGRAATAPAVLDVLLLAHYVTAGTLPTALVDAERTRNDG